MLIWLRQAFPTGGMNFFRMTPGFSLGLTDDARMMAGVSQGILEPCRRCLSSGGVCMFDAFQYLLSNHIWFIALCTMLPAGLQKFISRNCLLPCAALRRVGHRTVRCTVTPAQCWLVPLFCQPAECNFQLFPIVNPGLTEFFLLTWLAHRCVCVVLRGMGLQFTRAVSPQQQLQQQQQHECL